MFFENDVRNAMFCHVSLHVSSSGKTYGVWERAIMTCVLPAKQKMAPISLKDPNIQSLTEEFVKVLTGFKVIINLMAYEI